MTHRNGASHAAKVDTGNGHHDEAPETQRSLFSWAEFMAEEPVGRQNRRGKKEAFVAVPCSSGRSAWNKKGRKN